MYSVPPLLPPQYAKALDLKDYDSLSILKTELSLCKAKLNLLERWQLNHYKKTGFLGWVARFILKLLPSSQARLHQIDALESQLLTHLKPKAAITSKLYTLPQCAIPTIEKSPDLQTNNRYILEGDKKDAFTYLTDMAKVHKLNPAQLEIDPSLLEDKKFMLAVVKETGLALKFAADHLRADKKVVLAAVKEHGIALQFAADYLKADKKLVVAAISQNNPHMYRKTNIMALAYASSELKADKEFMLAAIKINGQTLAYAAPELKADKEVVLAAVKESGLSLQWASIDLQNDKEIVQAAVAQNSQALDYASPKLKAELSSIT